MKEKIGLLVQLIKLAKADEQVREQEKAFIHALGKSLGIPEEKVDSLFYNYIEAKPPALEPERIVQFQRLVLLANVDGAVVPSELAVLKAAGLRLGLNADAVENVLTEMKKHPNGMIPPEQLIAIFKVYHN